jgi:site-specific DNA-methyltransferase (adenine-specific)
MKEPKSEVYLADCMDIMKNYPDGYFELACTDPPYGIGDTTTSAGNKKRKTLHKRVTWNKDIPKKEYFDELYRISKNQIIWGCNYFYPYVSVPGRIVHYKKPFQNLNEGKIKFCPCDLASQSFNNRIEYFEYNWYGNSQGGKPNFNNSGPDARIHPTQKPIALYDWIFKKYAKEGDKIFDSHLGSGSSRISAYKAGLDFVGCEIDKDYYEAQEKRFKIFKSQLRLF